MKSGLSDPKSVKAAGIGVFLLCFLFQAAAAEEKGSHWQPLFNGRDLDNWTQNGSAKWIVKDGIIVGGQGGDPKRAGLLPDGH